MNIELHVSSWWVGVEQMLKTLLWNIYHDV